MSERELVQQRSRWAGWYCPIDGSWHAEGSNDCIGGPDEPHERITPEDTVVVLASDLRRLVDAVRWALGEVGEFRAGLPEGRAPGDGKLPRIGRFYWRKELRERAGVLVETVRTPSDRAVKDQPTCLECGKPSDTRLCTRCYVANKL
jgi:hypothetical protein